MSFASLQKEKIILVGLGSENYAWLKYIEKQHTDLDLTVLSFHSRAEMTNMYPEIKAWTSLKWRMTKPTITELTQGTLIIKSPGAYFSPALRKKLKARHITITSPMQLFLEMCPTKNIIGITGTKGKGTTASLLYTILKTAKKPVWLAGNIGKAPFLYLKSIKKNDWVILELSSFQLEDIHTSPKLAIITNFSAEHLAPADKQNPNFHPSLAHYWQAKYNLLRFQKKGDVAILNQTLASKVKKAPLTSKRIFFTKAKLPSQLVGEHNQENIAAAIAAAQVIGISKKIILTALKKFKGLPYRLEKITTHSGVTYYNDSFATTPVATITALKAFSQPIILIAGGADKGADFTQLAKQIKKYTKALILFKGTALKKLQHALQDCNYNPHNLIVVSSMAEAVQQAQQRATTGDIILLSPACASFGLFKNYKDRGEQFNHCL